MSIFSDLKPQNKAARNAFDLSKRVVFSNKMGVIRPCLALHTLPSSEYEIDMAQLMRTQPLQTAAFTGCSINYDFVFVPYNQLYSSFNEFIAQREDAHSAVQPSGDSFPTLNLNALLKRLLPLASLDYLLSGISDADWQKSVAIGEENDFYFFNMQRFSFVSSNFPSYAMTLSAISNLDLLGYGNYLPLVKAIAGVLEGYVLDNYSTNIPHVDGFNRLLGSIVEYLSDLTTQGSNNIISLAQTIYNAISDIFAEAYGYDMFSYIPNIDVSIWPLLAYNKAFYEYYRNTYYDDVYKVSAMLVSTALDNPSGFSSYTVNVPYVKLFNIDDGFDDFNTGEGVCRIFGLLAQKPHQYKRDLFTGVLPSTQFGDVSTMATDNDFRALLYKDISLNTPYRVGRSNSSSVVSFAPITSSGSMQTNTAVNKYDSAKFKFDPVLAISVLTQRQADAMQRFKERMLRAGNKTKDVFEAHGWSRPKSQSSFEPVFLGSYDGRLDINVVAATSDTANTELGQLGANGVSVVNGSKIHFKCSDFGVILCLQYIVKAAEYDAYGLDKHNTLLEAFDFPYPEFQNISLVPITQQQLNNISPIMGGSGVAVNPATQILGYLPRSYEYKSNVDTVHGEFFTSEIRPLFELGSYIMGSGSFSDWVAPRHEIQVNDSQSVAFHYEQINNLDNIFKVGANSLPDTDHFLFNCQFDIKAVQPLSVIGLPI